MLSTSRFDFSLKERKQGSKGTSAVKAYLGGPTSYLHLAAADLICHQGSWHWVCNMNEDGGLDETG